MEDDEHLAFAHGHESAVITFDCADFLELHRRWQGQAKPHSGIITIYRERDVSRNLTHAQTIVALRKLEVSGTPIANEFIVLNQWRWIACCSLLVVGPSVGRRSSPRA